MKKQSTYWIVLIFFSVFYFSLPFSNLKAQSFNLNYELISVEHGLSNRTVNDIIQDKNGFLWIATDNGLNKYDGYKFTVYKNDPDNPNSLCNNKVNDILDTDIYGRQVLWIGTEGGLSAFDVETERFINWRQINKRELSWDGNANGYHYVMYDSAAHEFKMWYTGYNTGFDDMKIGYAFAKETEDLKDLKWQKYTNNPVLENGEDGSWDSRMVGTPFVMKYNEVYHMYYAGVDQSNQSSIGYATSPDGIDWTKYSGNPVYKYGGKGSWTEGTAYCFPDIVRVGKKFHLWHSALDSIWEYSSIGHAISEDGIHWEKDVNNPVIRRGPPGSFDEKLASGPDVIYEDGLYRMWYSSTSISPYEESSIGYAESKDGSVWIKKEEPVFYLKPGYETKLWTESILYHNNKYHIWYAEGGMDFANMSTSGMVEIRYAVSDDGIHWRRETHNKIWQKEHHGLTSNIVKSIEYDSSGSILIGLLEDEKGMNQLVIPDEANWNKLLNGETTEFETKILRYLKSHLISDIEKDNSNFWIAANVNGIYHYNIKKQEFENYRIISKTPHYQPSFSIQSIHRDKNGNIWAGLENGYLAKLLLSENFSKYSFKYFTPENPSLIHKIIETDNGKLLLCSRDRGIKVFDISGESFDKNVYRNIDFGLLDNENINAVCQDESGLIWLGGDKGIYKFVVPDKTFEQYDFLYETQASSSDYSVIAISETEEKNKKNLWLATESNGLIKIDRNNNTHKLYIHNPDNKNSLSSNTLYSMQIDREGNIWAAAPLTMNKFNPAENKFALYKNEFHDQTTISREAVNSMYEDKSGVLWLSSGVGLQRYEKSTEQFIYVMDHFVQCFYQFDDQEKSTIWLGMYERGIRKFNKENNKYIEYLNDPNDPQSLSNASVNCIYGIDNNGEKILWIATDGGLNKAVVSEGDSLTFVHYKEEDGLPSNIIYAILGDEFGNLWLSTDRGISKFDPGNETFGNYDKSDGLTATEFNLNSSYKAGSGEIFFGSKNGLVSFFPEDIKDNPNVPQIVITDIQVFNKPVGIIPDIESNSEIFSIPKHISALDTLNLTYEENVFSLEFASLDYHDPQKNKYKYKLEGFENDWTPANSERRRVTYTNLDPGKYIFKVSGTNNDGLWNEAGKSLYIIISPPWWTTGWAYAAYIFLLLLVIYAIWRFQMSRIRLRHTAELEHVEAERYREMDQLKSRFFANISHEFRTPLTLILGPVEKMLAKSNGSDSTGDLKLIKRNAQRLNNLINQLLDLSKLEANQMSLQAGEYNIVPFIRGLVMSFISLAKRKNILLNVKTDNDEILLHFDKDKMNKILSNLVSNAFKFTDSGGRIEVSVQKVVQDDAPGKGHVEIRVKDTGVGIPRDRINKIFDRFYQVDGSQTREREGTGIGLSLTKELVELHKGKISVESEVGKGTSFKLQFPLGKDHLEPGEIAIGDETKAENESFIDEQELTTQEIQDNNLIEMNDNPIVLLVEDNADVRSYIKDYLQDQYNLIEADNGMDGLGIALDKIPDLIISDIMMPKMNGVELCNKLKKDERTSHIPVILLTAKASGEDKIEGLETGADDYIMKPFDAMELQVRIKNLIDQRRKLREYFRKQGIFQLEEESVTPADRKFLQRAIGIINDHISDINFNVNLFAEEMALSRSQLHRKFTALYNESPSDFIRRIRLSKAAKLIEQKFGNISEIALEVGFSNPAYFTQCFKDQFKKTPSEYEKSS